MRCFYCGHEHDNQKCPLVKAYEFNADHTIKRVEFVTIADMGGGFQLVDVEAEIPPGTTVQ